MQCIVALSKVDGMSNSPTFSYITFTARKYPFYLFQWHPAKPQFEWSRVKDIKHTQEAILAGQYWANFFVNQGNSLWNFTACIIHKKALLGPELFFIWLIWLKRTKHFTIDPLTNISIYWFCKGYLEIQITVRTLKPSLFSSVYISFLSSSYSICFPVSTVSIF